MCDLRLLPPTRVRDLTCHTRAAVHHAVSKDVLDRPFRGVLLGSDVARDPAVMIRAAQLSVGPALPGSHHSSAAVSGFGVIDDGRVHLCGGEDEVNRNQPGLRVHSTFRPPSTNRLGGVLVTGPNRTAIDLAREVNAREQLVVLDAALRTGLVSPESLATEAAAHAGLRGITSVRRMVAWADPRAESPQESRLRWILLAAGLPAPDLQIEVVTSSGRFRVDMGYERYKIGIEYDGLLHADRLAYDRARHNALDGLDWRLLYFTKRDVMRPNETAARVGRAIGIEPRLVVPTLPFPPQTR